MKHLKSVLLLSFVVLVSQFANAQGTAFTYQGRLGSSGAPANGIYDFRFRLAFDALGNSYAEGGAAVIVPAVQVSNGLFTATMDFGAGVFTGSTYYLEISVRTNGSASFTSLNPLQPLTPSPYAIMANSASNLLGVLPSSQLTGLYSGAVNFNNAGNTFNGSFAGNGDLITNVNAAAVGGVTASNLWQLGGNNVAPGQFLGSVNNQSVETRVNGQRALLISPSATDAPNIIGGSAVNIVDPGTQGAVIAGGGSTNFLGTFSSNHISADFAAIVGGSGNWIQSGADHAFIGSGWNNVISNGDYQSVIAGGQNNAIQTNSVYGTISGGNQNTVYGPGSTVGGGFYNVAAGTNAPGYTVASTIGGGHGNQALAPYAAIGGGINNIASGFISTVGGGGSNQATNQYATIAGGNNNIATGSASTVGGGQNNQATNLAATVTGGRYNTAAGSASTADGGEYNQAIGSDSIIAGGARNQATGLYSSILGGQYNAATNLNSTVVGGYSSDAYGQFSLAAGVGAQALHDGSFVWADSQFVVFQSTTNNEFNVRAQNGVRIQSDKGIHLSPGDEPLIVRDWDIFATNAPNSKVGIGRWGLFMEPYTLTIGIPSNDVAPRFFQVASYSTNGVPNPLMTVDQSGTVTASSFIGSGLNLTSLNASNLTTGVIPLAQMSSAVLTNNETSPVTISNALTIAPGPVALQIRQEANLVPSLVATSPSYSGTLRFRNALEVHANDAGTSSGYIDIRNVSDQATITLNGGTGSVTATSFMGNGANLTSLNATNLSTGTIAQQRLPSVVVTNNNSGSVTLSNSVVVAKGGVGINTTSILETGLSINTNTYLFSHPLYLRGDTGVDHNHGLAYSGNGVTNFASSVLPDGPVLWGYSGGALGAANPNNHSVLTWDNIGVSIASSAASQNSEPELTVTGARQGGFGTPVAYVHNNYGTGILNSAPALRVVGDGNCVDGALSVSTQGSGLIAEFGNSSSFVVTISTNGAVNAVTFNQTSDRNAKEDFTPVDARQVLDKVVGLPISEWVFKTDKDARHLGPVAQDFHQAFDLNGKDDKHISVVDEGGVALAAIQGLNQKLTEELKRRDAENAELKARLEKLEHLLEKKSGE